MLRTIDILIKPIISEQSLRDAANGKYTFLINPKATKTDVKRAVEEAFSVKVVKITTAKSKGTTVKMTRKGKKSSSFVNKKARVVLSEGQTIGIFEEHLGEKPEKKASSKTKEKKVEEKAKKETKKEKK